MSKVAIQGAVTGTGVFTLASPATNTDRTLVLPDEAGTMALQGGAGVGKVLQVVQTVKTDAWSTNSTTPSAPIQVTITPSSASSKILVLCDAGVGTGGAAAATVYLRKNGSAIYVGDAAGSRPRALAQVFTSSDYFIQRISGVYLDSPATTAAVTYSIALAASGPDYVHLNRTNADRDAVDSRAASSITVMEIAA
mgnify:CR=1 FL=1